MICLSTCTHRGLSYIGDLQAIIGNECRAGPLREGVSMRRGEVYQDEEAAYGQSVIQISITEG